MNKRSLEDVDLDSEDDEELILLTESYEASRSSTKKRVTENDIEKLNLGEWIAVGSPSVSTAPESGMMHQFYWLDAFADPDGESDAVYLFGKILNSSTQKYISASLCVKNVNRRIFLCPRKNFRNDLARKVTCQDVYNEFTEVAKKLQIGEFRFRKVVKKYAFELSDIPAEAEYLEVQYSASFQPLPPNYCSGNTYRHVFGANASILENLILELKLSGPQWLVVKDAIITETPVTWCKIELHANNQSQISLATEDIQTQTPELTVLSLNFKTYFNSEKGQNEIIAISGLVNRSYKFEQDSVSSDINSHFCFITSLPEENLIFPCDFNSEEALKGYTKISIRPMKNEHELLRCFLDLFHQIDADIVMGHDLLHFFYKILHPRFSHHKIPCASWAKLGRLSFDAFTNGETKLSQNVLVGRPICDLKIISKQLVKAESYDLTELSKLVLSRKRNDVFEDKLGQYYINSTKLITLAELMAKDNELITDIEFQLSAIPLAKQITNIVGNIFSKTLIGGQSIRNEYLLLHAFDSNGYIVPDKSGHQSASIVADSLINDGEQDGEAGGESKYRYSTEDQSSYIGGLVLEPKVGFYESFVVLMDYNSLYPSIIQEFDICFTTIDPNLPCDGSALVSKNPADARGVLPNTVRKLVNSRNEIKRQLNEGSNLSQEEKKRLDIKQKALKLIANSVYGCLGFSHSRFYAKHLAAAVTCKGREILLASKQMVEQMGYEVIYGDTDSLMIHINCRELEEVAKVAEQLQIAINRKYNQLEIGIDTVFQSFLLLKKKKYAGKSVHRQASGELKFRKEIKGLEIVRRDYAPITREAANSVLDMILNYNGDEAEEEPQPMERIVENIEVALKKLSAAMRDGQFGVILFVIKKMLTKDADEYLVATGQSVAATRFNQTNRSRSLRKGDVVPFVICTDGTRNPVAKRAYHIKDAREKIATGELELDIEYYISQQLLPVLTRLCEPIKELAEQNISKFLGIKSGRKRACK